MTSIDTVRLDTSQLVEGDIVLTYGMRVRIDSVREYDRDLPGDHLVWSCPGTVINLDEVRSAGVVPMGWLRTEKFDDGKGWVTDRDDQWTIQGNTLATWRVDATTEARKAADLAA